MMMQLEDLTPYLSILMIVPAHIDKVIHGTD